MRVPRRLTLTVGQTQGDLQGRDDKVIQAGIDYLARLGGGTLRILPGTYELKNAVYLRPQIALSGSGETTILRKTASIVTSLIRDSDWYEYGVQVQDPAGFAPGVGVMLRSSTGPGEWQFDVLRATITAVEGDVLFLDRMTKENFWIEKEATAATIFPLVTAEDVDDVEIENLVLDGNRDHNEHVNGNFAGAVFIQSCNRWRFRNVTARDYNGDGFSFQVCDDVQFETCRSLNNADLGFHPGSGSQRPVFRNCTAQGNSQGIFFCWGVCNGVAENCTLSDNRQFGVSIGHCDTDNVIKSCTIEGNGEVGVLFRHEEPGFRCGHRNRIEACAIRNNGIGIDIQGKTQDIAIVNTKFDAVPGDRQRIGLRIGPEARRIALQGNSFEGCPTQIDDLRSAGEESR